MEGKATQQLQDKARELQSRVGPQIEDARRSLNDFNQRMVAYIRERPGTSLLGAMVLGFIIGKIAARR